MQPIISVKGLSKRYKLGVFNAWTLREEAVPSTLDARLSAPSEQSSDFWAQLISRA